MNTPFDLVRRLLEHNTLSLGNTKQYKCDNQHRTLRDTVGIPNDAVAQQRGQSRDNGCVQHQRTTDIQDNGIAGALGRIQIGGNQGVQAHDDESPCILRQIAQRIGQGFAFCAEQRTDGTGEQDTQTNNDDAAYETNQQTSTEIPFQVLFFL